MGSNSNRTPASLSVSQVLDCYEIRIGARVIPTFTHRYSEAFARMARELEADPIGQIATLHRGYQCGKLIKLDGKVCPEWALEMRKNSECSKPCSLPQSKPSEFKSGRKRRKKAALDGGQLWLGNSSTSKTPTS